MKNFCLKKVFLIILCFSGNIFSINSAFAAAWTLEAGKSQLISTMTYFSSENYYDNRGTERSQLKFEKISSDVLFEYGFASDITLGLQPRFDVAYQDLLVGGSVDNSGLSSIDLFIRYQFLDEVGKFLEDDNWVISVQPKLVAPGSESKTNSLPISSGQWDAELRLLSGYSFKAFNNEYHYANLELGYKKRFERPSDEMFVDATLGLRFTEDWQLLGQAFYTKSLDVGKSSLSLASNRDYSLIKAQVSVVKRISDKYSVQAGVFSHLRGKNAGAGDGALISLWMDF